MSGVFAAYQPQYAAHGIPTFPVSANKVPRVRHYLRAGHEASVQYAMQFPDAAAFGLACGSRSRVTVLDIDSPDESLVADAIDEYGPTPLIVRSASGGHHLYYRHAGEARKIRPDASMPIDILGGGYVVAAPSRVTKGSYQIVQGRLDDLEHLPRMRVAPDQDNKQPQQQTKPWNAMREGDGRNAALLREVGRAAHYVDNFDALLDYAQTRNSEFLEPMSDLEVVGIAKSVWTMQTEGRNWFGVGKVVTATHAEIDSLLRVNPDAFLLLTVLRRHHWGHEFYIANAIADTMPGGGWSRQRLAAARKYLVETKRVIVVTERTRHTPTLFRFPGQRGCQDSNSNKKRPVLPSVLGAGD